MNVRLLRWLFLVLILCASAALRAQSYEITSPLIIPLVYSSVANKWGIELAMGGSDTPALFELDTGGTGFYAASGTDTNSPWWGSQFVDTGTAAYNRYDSGNTYTGNVVQTAVTFFNTNGSAIYTTTSTMNVAQSTTIGNTPSSGAAFSTTYWTTNGNTKPNTPPIDGAFYGDFGLALNDPTNYAANPVANLIAQMAFTNGVTAGFIVNTPLDGTNGYLQIGLSSSQTNQAGVTYFAMNPDTNAGTNTFAHSGHAYLSEQLFNATMTIAQGTNVYSTNVGITPDTGAVPALHNTTNALGFPTNWIVDRGNNNQELSNDLSFTLSGTNGSGADTNIFRFTTATANSEDYSNGLAMVTVQNDTNSPYTNYYFNSGLYLFNQHQVIYDLQNQQIGFGAVAVPEPSVAWLLLLGLAVLLIWKRPADGF